MRTPLVSAIAFALAGLSAVVAAAPAADTSYLATTQLPRSVRPSHYDVAVVPHADKLAFDGKVAITVDVLEPTTSITLNAVDMAFANVTLAPVKGKVTFAAPKVAVNADAQTATFTFDHAVPAGSYTLSMDYTGKIGTQPNGLFAIDYDTRTSGKKRALYTQFENSDARRFIPSWDEPAYKATFTLTATVPSADMAVNNMPVATSKDVGNGLKTVTFAQTPKMSTYLLFFGVGEFDRATTMSDGVEIGVITQKGLTSQAQFTLDSAKAVLHEYNGYFGVPYPLPKLDNIASPGQSQFFGAMENWGAIYTFEYALLLDPSISTQADKEEVFNTAAHEMAHQWFGDLVTMNWWDDLWLNEGFASWMASRTTERLHPEWHTNLDAISIREQAMGRDAIATTHPVVQKIDTVEQASQAFDSITYSKGESVIRMLEAYVGADTWQKGVQSYIKAHAYQNTVSDDLWKEIDAAAGKPVSTIAHDFTLQPGIPLVRVESVSCAAGSTTLKLSQGEFTRDRPDKKPLLWHVPVIAKTVGGAPSTTLLENGSGSVTVAGCGPVLVNAGQTAYFRTLYAPAQFTALKDTFTKLDPIDQLGITSDVWALGMAGLQPASDVLDLIKATPLDASPFLWDDIATDFTSLDSYFKNNARGRAALRRFASARLSPKLAQVGWEAKAGEEAPVANLRAHLIGSLGNLGDAKVIAEARRRYETNEVPPELRKTILAVVATNADAATWDKLHEQAKAEKSPLVKDRLYGLLADPVDDALAQRALDLALTGEAGQTNSAALISGVSRRHPELAFDFAVAHKGAVDKLVDSTSATRFYPMLTAGSSDLALADRIKAFADKSIAASSRRDTDTAIAGVRYRNQVLTQRIPAVEAWLKKNG
ncbi:M1 family metallopeptidase [Luteibacter sp. 22Crub2.1]|uniref:M1 family metallopeptidase n=1 Tax=Luteibacter sp. 22Crub2.1 TaxID=1283288 RepID=UPI0009A5C4D6|nr:M1 family metallopeptidase [Luteibacter sp. 22Crub2.1]SKB70913.1 aminopeptidase N [Luteibacter sp. 22Crub2.1]